MKPLTRRLFFIWLAAWPAAATAQAPAKAVEYVHLDAAGSVRVVTDRAGHEIERHDYLPFGEELCGAVPCGSVGAGLPVRFTSKERDAETALDYFGARYYASQSGRLTTVDPVFDVEQALGHPQLWNRYTYALNNPLKYFDPSGAAIELLGSTDDDRKRELAVLRRSAGPLWERLYINTITHDGKTRYFVGIRGDVGDFTRAGGTAQMLANLVASWSVVEFGLTSRDLSREKGAKTFEPGWDGDNQNTRVLVNPDQMSLANQLFSSTSVPGSHRFEGDGAWRIRPVTVEVATWHEFGHAWGVINGRSMQHTNEESRQWENQMRQHLYGPLGRDNAPRVRE